MNMRPLDLILILVIGFLLFDKFKAQPGNSKGVVALNGASANTAPNIIQNGSEVGDNFDLQVDAMVKGSGLI